MKITSVGKRLSAVADFVRDGAILADVGTDHAYLPLYLLGKGRISCAVCSDINEGPLLRAKENVAECGFSDRVSFHLENGAERLASMGITDYAICGMGGELISEIIEHAPQLSDNNIRLILQPMTKPEILREYLWTHGFEILKERHAEDEGKCYVVFLVQYVGGSVAFSGCDAYFGKPEAIENINSAEADAYLSMRAAALVKAAEGKRRGGLDTAYENSVIDDFEKQFRRSV